MGEFFHYIYQLSSQAHGSFPINISNTNKGDGSEMVA
jgi:hypothetical protein